MNLGFVVGDLMWGNGGKFGGIWGFGDFDSIQENGIIG